jgi:MerR family mercuric resistance operon transcriptional regulator
MEATISTLAEMCGVNKETVRYYERKQLISPSNRNDSGYRIYGASTVKRITFIKQLQRLGFSLQEIHKLLGVVDKDQDRCKDMYGFVSQKQQEVAQKIQDFQRMNQLLLDLQACCPNEEDLFACPIIEKMVEDPPENTK